MTTVTPEQRQLIDQAGDRPVELTDPETNRTFYLVKSEVYRELRGVLEEKEFCAEIARVAPKGGVGRGPKLVPWSIGLILLVIGADLFPFAMIGLIGILALLAGFITCGMAISSSPAKPASGFADLSRSVFVVAGLIGMLLVAAATPIYFTSHGGFSFPGPSQLAGLLGAWLAVPTMLCFGIVWRNGLAASEAFGFWLSTFAIFPAIAFLYAFTDLPRSL